MGPRRSIEQFNIATGTFHALETGWYFVMATASNCVNAFDETSQQVDLWVNNRIEPFIWKYGNAFEETSQQVDGIPASSDCFATGAVYLQKSDRMLLVPTLKKEEKPTDRAYLYHLQFFIAYKGK